MKPRSNDPGLFGRWSDRKRKATRPSSTSAEGRARPVRYQTPLSAAQDNTSFDAVCAESALPAAAIDCQEVPVAPGRSGSSRQSCPVETGPLPSVPPSAIDTEPTVLTNAPRLTDADMPPIDSLTAQSDLSGFFSDGVSATLRKAALRQVFRQPIFNVRDGLNDYDGDFTAFEPLGDTVTADMKFHAMRRAAAQSATEQPTATPIVELQSEASTATSAAPTRDQAGSAVTTGDVDHSTAARAPCETDLPQKPELADSVPGEMSTSPAVDDQKRWVERGDDMQRNCDQFADSGERRAKSGS